MALNQQRGPNPPPDKKTAAPQRPAREFVMADVGRKLAPQKPPAPGRKPK